MLRFRRFKVCLFFLSGKARAEQTEQIYRHYNAFYGACSEDILLQRSHEY